MKVPNDEDWDMERDMYFATSNPLYVWHTYLNCRRLKCSIPYWVHDYLEHVAVNIIDLPEKYASQGDCWPPKNTSAAIAEAFEMKRPGQSGRGTMWGTFFDRDFSIAGFVSNCIRHEVKSGLAYEYAAKYFGVSKTTAMRASNKYGNTFNWVEENQSKHNEFEELLETIDLTDN